jgi:hypothetical protein
MLEMAFDDSKLKALQRGPDCFYLHYDFRAVTTINDHSLNSLNLPLDTAQALELWRVIVWQGLSVFATFFAFFSVSVEIISIPSSVQSKTYTDGGYTSRSTKLKR